MGYLKLIVILCVLAACQESGETERKNGYTKDLKSRQDSLFQEVMDGHDVGMAKMGKIRGYSERIKKSIDSLQKLKKADTSQLPLLRSIAADLNQAEYGMNRWMEEFVLDSAENNQPVRIAYLESERDIVNRVRDRILGSLQRADSLYGKKEGE